MSGISGVQNFLKCVSEELFDGVECLCQSKRWERRKRIWEGIWHT